MRGNRGLLGTARAYAPRSRSPSIGNRERVPQCQSSARIRDEKRPVDLSNGHERWAGMLNPRPVSAAACSSWSSEADGPAGWQRRARAGCSFRPSQEAANAFAPRVVRAIAAVCRNDQSLETVVIAAGCVEDQEQVLVARSRITQAVAKAMDGGPGSICFRRMSFCPKKPGMSCFRPQARSPRSSPARRSRYECVSTPSPAWFELRHAATSFPTPGRTGLPPGGHDGQRASVVSPAHRNSQFGLGPQSHLAHVSRATSTAPLAKSG